MRKAALHAGCDEGRGVFSSDSGEVSGTQCMLRWPQFPVLSALSMPWAVLGDRDLEVLLQGLRLTSLEVRPRPPLSCAVLGPPSSAPEPSLAR